jgi:hypothetical protein
MAKPPTISQPHSNAASASGLRPAFRIAEECVVTPSAAIAMARTTVSILSAADTTALDKKFSELIPATAMKPNANHGITMPDAERAALPAPAVVPEDCGGGLCPAACGRR